MKIYFLDKVLECKSEMKSIIDILKYVEKLASKSNYGISHLEIDGEEVYDDFHLYFSNNLEDIKNVKVITKNPRELARDLIVCISETTEELLPDIEVLANDFRRDVQKSSWENFINIFKSIKWILDAFATLDSDIELMFIVNDYEKWNYFAKDIYNIREIMVELQNILLSEDYVYIPEILTDEIVPLLNDMKDKLDSLVDSGVDLKKLN